MRCERPGDGRAADKPDELAPPHGSPFGRQLHPTTSFNATRVFCITAKLTADVAVGSLADLTDPNSNFRFTPDNGHAATSAAAPRWSKMRHHRIYSITSSAP